MSAFNIKYHNLLYMSLYTVAIIDPNITLTDIPSYVTIHDILFENLMELVIDTINLTPDLVGDTDTIYETADNIYQLCHLNQEHNGGKDDEANINKICTQLVNNGEKVYGKCVIICSLISPNGTCIPASITLEDVTNILRSKLYHKAINIQIDGTITEIEFTINPLEGITIQDNYKSIEVPFLKFNLLAFCELKPENDTINKKASRFIGRHRVHGNIIIAAKSSEFEYIDIDSNIFDQLFQLSSLPLSERKLNDAEKHEEEEKAPGEQNDLPIIQNRYNILKKRISEYKDVCMYCKTELFEPLTCTGCYWARYHDITCQQKDWINHKQDCNQGKPTLNNILVKNFVSI